MTVTAVNGSNEFNDVIKKHSVVIVDFTAKWCGPCRAIAPRLEQWSEEFPNIHYIKVDVDDNEDIAKEYGIRAMPTFIVFKDGEKVADLLGANPPGLLNLIQNHHET